MCNDLFDEKFKSSLNISNYYEKPSKNIFEQAWSNRNNLESKASKSKLTRNIAASFILCTILFSGIALSMSSDVRVLAKETYRTLRSIFILEKSGDDYKIVEKSEEYLIPVYNYGGMLITDSNRSKFEKRIGFSIYLPEKIAEDFQIHTNSGKPDIQACVSVYNIKLDDAEKLSQNFYEFISKDVESSETKKFEKKLSVYSCYSDNKGHNYLLSMEKKDKSTKETERKDKFKELNIENIKCKVLESTRTFTKAGGNLYLSDIKSKPDEIVKVKHIQWEADGISFSLINLNNNETDIDNASKFIKEYMKTYKNKE